MKNIEQYKEQIKKYPKESIKRILENTLEKITFLESIYTGGGIHNDYSEKFKDSAYEERQELCQLSSACYSLLRKL